MPRTRADLIRCSECGEKGNQKQLLDLGLSNKLIPLTGTRNYERASWCNRREE